MYHYICLNMSHDQYKDNKRDLVRSWRCPSCANVNSKRRGENTPVRRQGEVSKDMDMSYEDTVCVDDGSPVRKEGETLPTTEEELPKSTPYEHRAPAASLQDISNLLDEKLGRKLNDILDTKLGDLRDTIALSVKTEFHSVIEKIKEEFTATTDFLTAQIQDLDNSVKLSERRIQSLEGENMSLRSEIHALKEKQSVFHSAPELMASLTRLQDDLNYKEQQSLLNDVEINGIPEFDGESVIHLVKTTASKLGSELEDRDIISATRAGPKRTKGPREDPDKPPRPRPIVVRLARQSLRDNLIKSSRSRRGTTSDGFGLPVHEPNKISVFERLTKVNRDLFFLVRKAGKDKEWSYIWTNNGRIFARKTDTSRIHNFRNENDYVQVFQSKKSTEDN